MPKYGGRRRSVRRTFRGRRTMGAAASASRAARTAAVAARRAESVAMNVATRGLQLAQGEFKSVDTANTLAVNSTGTMALLNGIARGDEINERNGREVTMKSIEMRGWSYVTAGTGIDQTHRVLVVYDRQTNATAPAIADVIGASTLLPRNLENRRRFKILYDRTYPLNATAEAGSQKTFKFYRRLAHPITFNAGDAGTVADITTGSLYVMTIGSVAAGTTAGSVQVSCRIRYQDK